MGSGIIVQFNIEETGEHVVISADDFKTIVGAGNGDMGALLSIAGPAAVVGLVVKVHRRRAGVGTLVVATAAGVSDAMVSRVENGQKALDADLLAKFERALPGLTADLERIGFNFEAE